MISSLTEDIRGASLQLTHFVYVNDSNLMNFVAMTDADSIKERNLYERKMEDIFKIAMAPRQDIISCMFYMRSGGSTYVKDRVIIPNEIIKSEKWYSDALKEKNIVKVGSYDVSVEGVTKGLKGREFVIALGLSPNLSVDKTGKTEMVSIMVQTKVGKLLKENNKNAELGTTIILDENNEIIYGSTINNDVEVLIEQMDKAAAGVFHKTLKKHDESKENYTYVLSSIDETKWKMITYIEKGYLTAKFTRAAFYMMLIIISLFLLFIVFSRYFLKNIISPISNIISGFKETEIGNLDNQVTVEGHSEIKEMIKSYNHMTKRLKISINEKEDAQKRKYAAEMRALQSQINPHFLVNTLNSIKFIAQVSKFDSIKKMAESLIYILSCSFRENTSLYTVAEEINLLESYIYLMKIRYSDGFEVDFEIDNSCLDFKVPRLILQPILENSIVHGFSEKEDIGLVKISVYKDYEFLYFEILDDGKGIDKNKIEEIYLNVCKEKDNSYNIGIENVQSRLKLKFGDKCNLKIESEINRYTKTLIKLPIVLEEENNVK
ncbi:MAG: sensor histidine kinase [Lachnospirales bacterium]